MTTASQRHCETSQHLGHGVTASNIVRIGCLHEHEDITPVCGECLMFLRAVTANGPGPRLCCETCRLSGHSGVRMRIASVEPA